MVDRSWIAGSRRGAKKHIAIGFKVTIRIPTF
jgi:hypothetical protein